MVEEQQQEVKEEDMITKANSVAERLERANKMTDENIRRLEKLESQRILGGLAMAGNNEVKPPPETPAEYAKRMLRGGQ